MCPPLHPTQTRSPNHRAGWKWLLQLARLVVYAILLLPGFGRMMAFYFLSPRVRRDIPYGRKVGAIVAGSCARCMTCLLRLLCI